VLLALLLAALPVAGAEDDDDADAPGEVVVVEAQAASPDHRTLDEADIARAGAESVATLLEQDVSITASTGGRGERLITLRGFDQRQVAVFLDGVPATVPYDGYQDLNRLPATLLGRVEIVPGPSAGIFGPHSLGGAVQLRTRPAPAEPEHLALLRAAAHGALDAAAYAGGPVGPLRVRVGGGGRSTPGDPLPASFTSTEREDGGLRDNSDRWSEDAHLRADLDLGRGGNIAANANYLQGDWGVPGSLEDARPRYWRWSDYRDLSTSLRHDGRPEARLRDGEVVWYGRNVNVLDAYDDATLATQESAGAFHSTYRDERLGGAATLSAQPGLTPLSLGAWLFADHQVHHSQGDRGEAWERIGTTLMSGAVTAETQSETWIDAFAGLELDAELPGQGTTFAPAPLFLGPSLGVKIRPVRPLDTSLGVARRSRAPTLKERFSEGMGYREPNLALGPESAWHFGWDLRVHPVEATVLTLSLYDAEVRGLIEEVPLGDGLSQMQNVERARLLGAEVGADAALPDWLGSRLALGLLRAHRLDVAPPDDRLEYRPGWQARWVETLHLGHRLELRSNLSFVGAQWFLDDDTLEWRRLGAYWLWDAFVAFSPTTRTTLRVRAENLLDASYQTHFGYPDPGRTVWFEAEARL
jgi:iron complex outermembrane receptor protein